MHLQTINYSEGQKLDVKKKVSSHGVVNTSSSVRSCHSGVHKWFLNCNLLLAFSYCGTVSKKRKEKKSELL